MSDLSLGTDLITADEEHASRILARTKRHSRAVAYLTQSGRDDIRAHLTALRRYVIAEMAEAGLDMVVETTDAQEEARLWMVDETAWQTLATSSTSTVVLDKNDVLRMHGLTLKKLLDPEELRAMQRQIDKSRLPPDPASNVAFERWHEQRVKNDVVWAYVRGHLPEEHRDAPHKDGRRLNMVLNSATLYLYMVTLNPSAYGTHVRKLLRGAVQFAVHHVLARSTLGADTEAYVTEHVEPVLQAHVRGVLAAPGIETQVQELIDESTEHGEAYARAKATLLATLERTRLVRDVRTILDRNSIDTDTRDELFASLFSMYKLVNLIRIVARFVADSSTDSGAETGALERAASKALAGAEALAGPAQDLMVRNARKIIKGIRDFNTTRTASGSSHVAAVVAKQTEHMILATHHLTLLHVRAQLIAEAAEAQTAPLSNNARPSDGAKSAFVARRLLQLHREYKQCVATMKALVARALRMLHASRFSLSKTGSVAQVLSFMSLRMAATEAYAKKKAPQSPAGIAELLHSLRDSREAHLNAAVERVAAYRNAAGAERGREPFALNIADFGKQRVDHRTPNTIAMLDTFFLSGVLRTLHTIDKSISVVVFELVAKKKAKPAPPAYVRAISDLRETLVQFIMERRQTVALHVADAVAARLRASELGTILEQQAVSALRLIMDRIYDTPLGVAFACSASSIRKESNGDRPYGVTSAFDYEWARLEAGERPSITSIGAAGEIFDSELPQGLTRGVDINRPYVYGPHADY
jgi:hypothetical protein